MDKVLTGAEWLSAGFAVLWVLGGAIFVFYVLRSMIGR